MPMSETDYRRVARAIRFLQEHAGDQPSLDEVAQHVGLSPFHFQRLFKRWAGVSPKRFLQFLTVEHAKRLLRDSRSVLDTTFEVGLSGPGRLHDLFVSVEAVTPGQFKSRGLGVRIRYGIQPSPFGDCLLAMADQGICHLGFLDEGGAEAGIEELRQQWRGTEVVEERRSTREVAQRVFAPVGARPDATLPLLLRGTNFQIKVWHALLCIPEGSVISYGDLAERLGSPRATRAVASAVGRNPISYLVPCHRVLRSTGATTGYRWGPDRKRAMLAREFSSAG